MKIKTILYTILLLVILIIAGFCYFHFYNKKMIYPQEVYAPILAYHGIDDKKAVTSAYFLTQANFTSQMQWLKDNHYTVISMDKLYNGLSGQGKLPPKPVVITFDDGEQSNFIVAYPILKKFHYPATFFITTSLTNQNPDYMTWAELKEMVANGMIIGSHTVNHINIAKMRLERVEPELIDSKKALETNLGIKVKYFSYPNGGYKNRDMEVKEAGYKIALTTHQSVIQKINSPDSLYALSRYEVFGNLPITFDQIFNPTKN